MTRLPLSGFRVLDLTRVLAGPLASQMLGDLGADVIKVERPVSGDESRSYGPPYLCDPDGEDTGNTSWFLCANRNKRSITVDISKPEGQKIIRALARECDVFMENFKVGDLQRFGLDYASIQKINPAIVYCSVTGFGQTGPYAPRPGYDSIFQAMGGMMSVTGHPDGEPGAGPMKAGPAVVDYMTGQNASIAILAALLHRAGSAGDGQHLDVCLFDTVVASMSHVAQAYFIDGQLPQRSGTRGGRSLPSGTMRCADGDLMLVIGNMAHLQRVCAVLGVPELATDPRLVGDEDDGSSGMKLLGERFATDTVAHWLGALASAGVPCGPVNDMRQVFADVHLRERGMEVQVEHAFDPSLSLLRNPLSFSGTPLTRYRRPPRLGEDTQDVLSTMLGYDTEAIARLRREGAI